MVVLAINWTITRWVSRGLPRQFWVMKANSRCSIRFHLTRLFRLRPLSSNSVIGQRMAVSLGVELSNRFVDGAVEVIRTVERLMSEVMPLQVAPETLDVVQLRSIFRQPLDGEPVCALGERGAACLAGVDRAVVQDEHEGLDRDAELGTIATVDLLQESDEV